MLLHQTPYYSLRTLDNVVEGLTVEAKTFDLATDVLDFVFKQNPIDTHIFVTLVAAEGVVENSHSYLDLIDMDMPEDNSFGDDDFEFVDGLLEGDQNDGAQQPLMAVFRPTCADIVMAAVKSPESLNEDGSPQSYDQWRETFITCLMHHVLLLKHGPKSDLALSDDEECREQAEALVKIFRK